MFALIQLSQFEEIFPVLCCAVYRTVREEVLVRLPVNKENLKKQLEIMAVAVSTNFYGRLRIDLLKMLLSAFHSHGTHDRDR